MNEVRKIDSNTPVRVVSNYAGIVFFKNTQTQAKYEWEEYGTFYDLFYADVLNMRNSASGLLLDGYLIIEDEDVIKQMMLQDLYKNILKSNEVDGFFKQTPKKMKEQLKKMPKGMKELLYAKAKEKVQNNEKTMDSRAKQRVFEDEFGVKFEDEI